MSIKESQTIPALTSEEADDTPAAEASPRHGLTGSECAFLIALAIVAGLAELGIAIVNFATMPVFLKEVFHLTTLSGIVMAVFQLVEALGNSPMGALSDKVGRRRMMVVSALLCAATSVGYTFLPVRSQTHAALTIALLLLFVFRILDGVGAAMFWPAAFASVSDRIAPERQNQGMSALNVTFLVGITLGPFIEGILNEHFAWRYAEDMPQRYAPAFYAAAACFVLIAVISAIIAPRKATHHVQITTDAPGIATNAEPANAVATGHESAPLDAIKHAVRHYPMVLLMGFLVFCGPGMMAPTLKLFLVDRLSLTESEFGALFLWPTIAIGILSFPLSKLGDRIGKVRAIQIGLATCAASLWGMLAVTDNVIAVVVGSLLGAGFILCFPAYMAYVSELAEPEDRAGAIGAARMAQGIGMLTGMLASSPLYLLDSKHRGIFIAASSLLTIGWLMSLFVLKKLGATPPAEPSRNGHSEGATG